MGRSTTWKEMHIRSGDEWSALYSYYLSSKGAWTKYSIEFDRGNQWLLTNLPWSELRAWFTFACVPLPKDILTATAYPYPEEEVN